MTGGAAALERTPLDPATLSEAARKILGGPAPMKMMAARGLAPLGPVDLSTVVYQLALDPDEKLRAAAEKAAAELPDKQLEPALAGQADPRVLDFFAERIVAAPGGRPGLAGLIEVLLTNKALADDTARLLAQRGGEALCQRIAVDEARILRAPAILTALYLNPKARMSTVHRLIELAVRNKVPVDGIPAYEEIVAAIEGGHGLGAVPGDVDAAFDAAVATDADGGSHLGAPAVAMAGGDSETAAAGAPDPDAEAKAEQIEKEAEAAEPKKQRIEELPIPAKIRLATLGNAFHRAVLIRDSNRQVAMAAIRSPAVTDIEIIRIASNRAISDEIIRYVANRKEFVRHYQVKVNLVNNPKCPLATSLRILPYLHERDLKQLARSKGIPSSLTLQAKRLVDQRSGGQRR